MLTRADAAEARALLMACEECAQTPCRCDASASRDAYAALAAERQTRIEELEQTIAAAQAVLKAVDKASGYRSFAVGTALLAIKKALD